MAKLVAYYHVYLTDNPATWSSIVTEQLDLIERTGLLKELDQIRVTCITQKNSHAAAIFSRICMAYSSKINITFVENPYLDDDDMVKNLNSQLTVTENVTMRRIWNDSQNEDMHILYFHTKGITSVIRHLTTNPETYLTYHYWRQFLNWGVIENWKSCVFGLQYHDVAGVNYYTNPSPHFSGGFWWTNSSYIKKLPDPSSLDWWKKLQADTSDIWLKTVSDRFRDEQWLCSIPHVVCDIYTPKINPAAHILKRDQYEDRANLVWHPV